MGLPARPCRCRKPCSIVTGASFPSRSARSSKSKSSSLTIPSRPASRRNALAGRRAREQAFLARMAVSTRWHRSECPGFVFQFCANLPPSTPGNHSTNSSAVPTAGKFPVKGGQGKSDAREGPGATDSPRLSFLVRTDFPVCHPRFLHGPSCPCLRRDRSRTYPSDDGKLGLAKTISSTGGTACRRHSLPRTPHTGSMRMGAIFEASERFPHTAIFEPLRNSGNSARMLQCIHSAHQRPEVPGPE